MKEKKPAQLWLVVLFGFNAIIWTVNFILHLVFGSFDPLTVLQLVCAVLWFAAFLRLLFQYRREKTRQSEKEVWES